MASGVSGDRLPRNEQQLLETAAREFARVGYERASLNAIIGACGMSKSSFYHYFDSKAMLFDRVVQQAAAHLVAELAVPEIHALDCPGFWDRMSEVGQQLMTLATRESWYADFGRLFYLSDAPVEHSPALQEVTRSVQDWVQRTLQAGRRCGAVRDDMPPDLLLNVIAALLQSLDRWSLHHTDRLAQNPALAETQVDLLRRLCEPARPCWQRNGN